MSSSRKPTVLGVPAPVPPAPTTPAKAGALGKPALVDIDSPPTIDEEMPAENTTIDSSMPGFANSQATPITPRAPMTPVAAGGTPAAPAGKLPDAASSRWEESTVAEKSSSKKSGLPGAASEPISSDESPMATGSSPLQPTTPMGRLDDSARVLVDIVDADPPGGSTAVDDDALPNMPTAISPAATGIETQPHGLTDAAPGRITVIGGNDRGREFVLTQRETSIGRGADNDIILTDIAVSRRHLSVHTEAGRFGLRDLSSGNGTLVNGVRITGDVFVHDGDQVEIGNTLLRFDLPENVSTVTSPPFAAAAMASPSSPSAPPAPPVPRPPLPGLPPGFAGKPTAPVAAQPPPPPASVNQPSAPPGMLAGPLPLPPQPGSFVPVGSAVPPPAAPLPPGVPTGPATFSPPVFLGPQNPSARAMDLFKGQRKLIIGLAGGFLGLGLLIALAVRLSGQPDPSAEVQSTEAATSPALDALLADVDRPAALAADAAPAAPSAALAVAPTPTPTPSGPAAAPPTPTPSGPAATPPAATPSPPVVTPAPPRPAPTPKPPRAAKPPKREPPRKPPPKPGKARPAPAPADETSGAERTAANFYKAKEFARASEVLQSAAAKESGGDADRLEATAKDYASVGAYMAKGDANLASNPTTAMSAYKQAYMLDARSGRGAHASYLKGQLAKVAPKAALSLFNSGKFEAARTACDDADNFGADDAGCDKVRNLLENKAKELYTQGASLSKSKPDEAKALWRRVLKMVPQDSPWYTKSYAALNKSLKTRPVDEDE